MTELTFDAFAPHLETDFRLVDPPVDEAITLRLTEVRSLGRQPDAPRVEPFALVFTGPPQPILEQRIYRLDHEALGAFDIFLVPIGYDAAGSLCYEAVFN